MPNEVKLLPCPLCNSEVFLEEGYGTDPSASILHLARNGGHDCPLADGVSDWNCETDIVTLWNTRPTTVVTDEVVERMREALEQIAISPSKDSPFHPAKAASIARSALASMPTVVTGEQPGWQPIESAPIGKIVLAWCPKHHLVALERRDGKLTETWAISPSGRADCPEPTHWQPLPEPPAQPGDA